MFCKIGKSSMKRGTVIASEAKPVCRQAGNPYTLGNKGKKYCLKNTKKNNHFADYIRHKKRGGSYEKQD